MIEIICTNCQEPLRIEDAFAGGVCRCRHCRTIQTVPSMHKLAKAGYPVPQPIRTGGSRRRPGQPPGNMTSGTGLEELGELVSSGSLSSATRSRRGHRKPPMPAAGTNHASQRMKLPLLFAVGTLVVVVGGLLAFAFWPAEAAVAKTPMVLDMVLPPAGAVVFVVDIGPSFREHRPEIAALVRQSSGTLSEGRPVQLLTAGDKPVALFPAAPTPCSPQTPEQLHDAIRGVKLADSADLAAALETAESHALAGESPGVVVLISAKAWQLSADQLHPSTGKVPIIAIAIEGDSFDRVFAGLASKTGGQSRVLSTAELESAVSR